MIEDKIALAIKDITKFKEQIKGIKKDMKAEEKIENEQYTQLKASYKDLRDQIKAIEEEHEQDLKKDDFYNKLRELKMKTDEDLAKSTEDLFKAVMELPRKHHQMKIETEDGPLNLQIQPDLRVYVNGREEKKRV